MVGSVYCVCGGVVRRSGYFVFYFCSLYLRGKNVRSGGSRDIKCNIVVISDHSTSLHINIDNGIEGVMVVIFFCVILCFLSLENKFYFYFSERLQISLLLDIYLPTYLFQGFICLGILGKTGWLAGYLFLVGVLVAVRRGIHD